MKDWQFWALMSSLWFTHPFSADKADKIQTVVCLICVVMLLYSIFPEQIHSLLHP